MIPSLIKRPSSNIDNVPVQRCIQIGGAPLRLRRIVNRELLNERHRENCVRLWIQEAKHVTGKRKYRCDIMVNWTLYARTTVKTMTDMLFWGEEFEFQSLQDSSIVTVELWEERSSKKLPKEKRVCSVTIPLSGLSGTGEVEQWYTGTSEPSHSALPHLSGKRMNTFNPDMRDVHGGSHPNLAAFQSGLTKISNSLCSITSHNPHQWSPLKLGKRYKEQKQPSIRIRVRYLSIEILPLTDYLLLSDFLLRNSLPLVSALEEMMTAKNKEDLTAAMVNIHQKGDTVDHFLSELVLHEMNKHDDDELILRGNSLASKAMECYLKLVGDEYLSLTLSKFVEMVVISPEECEVDTTKMLEPSSLNRNQIALMSLVDIVWDHIKKSYINFPGELSSVFSLIRVKCQNKLGHRGDSVCDRIISACLFLRLLCPAIMSPSLFGLLGRYPDSQRVARNFTLVAKSIQTLANMAPFQEKEAYMRFMDRFIEKQLPAMRRFIRQISSDDVLFASTKELSRMSLLSSMTNNRNQATRRGPEAAIDVSYELAIIHQQLTDMLSKLTFEKWEYIFTELQLLLAEITDKLNSGKVPGANRPEKYVHRLRSSSNTKGKPESARKHALAKTSLVSSKEDIPDGNPIRPIADMRWLSRSQTNLVEYPDDGDRSSTTSSDYKSARSSVADLSKDSRSSTMYSCLDVEPGAAALREPTETSPDNKYNRESEYDREIDRLRNIVVQMERKLEAKEIENRLIRSRMQEDDGQISPWNRLPQECDEKIARIQSELEICEEEIRRDIRTRNLMESASHKLNQLTVIQRELQEDVSSFSSQGPDK